MTSLNFKLWERRRLAGAWMEQATRTRPRDAGAPRIAARVGCSSGEAVQVALQQNCSGHLVHLFLAFVAADAGLDQKAICLDGGKTLVPGLHGNGDGIAQRGGKILNF